MKYKKLKLLATLLLSTAIASVSAQQATTTTGGDAFGSGGIVNYSVGQVFYTTNSGTSGSITQGVQQPYEIFIVLGLEEAVDIALFATAYPNPTVDFLNLKVENYQPENLAYQIYTINGKLLEQKNLGGNETKINMSNFPNAVYFLKIIKNYKEVKIFKIIKK